MSTPEPRHRHHKAEAVHTFLIRQIHALDHDANFVFHRATPVQAISLVARIHSFAQTDTKIQIQLNDDTGLLNTCIFKNGPEFPVFVRDLNADDLRSQYYSILLIAKVFKNAVTFITQNLRIIKDHNFLMRHYLLVINYHKVLQKDPLPAKSLL